MAQIGFQYQEIANTFTFTVRKGYLLSPHNKPLEGDSQTRQLPHPVVSAPPKTKPTSKLKKSPIAPIIIRVYYFL
jgi:hypothetical protein